MVMVGTGQVGNRNRMVVEHVSPFGGRAGNILEAIRQTASNLLPSTTSILANSLMLRQTIRSGSRDATQRVGQVVQQNTAERAREAITNSVLISQTGDAAGQGNVVLSALQRGSGNSLDLDQTGSGNRLGATWQSGTANGAHIEMTGNGNGIGGVVAQFGEDNALALTLNGSRNVVGSIVQNNMDLPGGGNAITLALLGDENGGDGPKAMTDFADIERGIAVPQASIAQIGGGNRLSYLTTQMSSGNRYGFLQVGTGNVLFGTVDGTANQTALEQRGDGNYAAFEQEGEGNAIGARFVGERNETFVHQEGSGNRAFLKIDGDDNNRLGPVRLTGQLLVEGLREGLDGGEIRQIGSRNLVDLVISGSRNLFAILQSGSGNTAGATMTGSGNQVLVAQRGSHNLAAISQSGNGNRTLIRQ